MTRVRNSSDPLGDSVAISGSTILVGTFGFKPPADRAYVFTKTAAGWTQHTVTGGEPFGESVAISGTTAVTVASAERVYLFEA